MAAERAMSNYTSPQSDTKLSCDGMMRCPWQSQLQHATLAKDNAQTNIRKEYCSSFPRTPKEPKSFQRTVLTLCQPAWTSFHWHSRILLHHAVHERNHGIEIDLYRSHLRRLLVLWAVPILSLWTHLAAARLALCTSWSFFTRDIQPDQSKTDSIVSAVEIKQPFVKVSRKC